MQWLVDHPEFISNPFYVGGDSYAGIPVSIVTQLISNGIDFQLSRNEDWLSAYNLKFSTRLGKCFALVCNYSNFQLILLWYCFCFLILLGVTATRKMVDSEYDFCCLCFRLWSALSWKKNGTNVLFWTALIWSLLSCQM